MLNGDANVDTRNGLLNPFSACATFTQYKTLRQTRTLSVNRALLFLLKAVKACLHIACAFASTPAPSFVLSEWLTQRMGLKPFSACASTSPLTQYKT